MSRSRGDGGGGAREVTAAQALAAGAEGRLRGSVVSDMAIEKTWAKWSSSAEEEAEPKKGGGAQKPAVEGAAARRKPRPVRL